MQKANLNFTACYVNFNKGVGAAMYPQSLEHQNVTEREELQIGEKVNQKGKDMKNCHLRFNLIAKRNAQSTKIGCTRVMTHFVT
jgi:hypothetical protein